MPTRSVALNSLAVLDSVAQTLPSEVDESPASENRYGSDLSLSWLPQGRFHRAGFVVASIQEPVQSFAAVHSSSRELATHVLLERRPSMSEPASNVVQGQQNEDSPGGIPRDNRTLTHKTASGVAWISLFQIARQLLQIASVSVLARRVPHSAYGLLAMAALITALLETVRDAGIGSALVREREVSDDLAATVFWLTCGLGIVITLIMIAVSWPAARFFREPQVATVLQFLSIGFFMGTTGVVPLAMLNRE